jgi:hypothetical protein
MMEVVAIATNAMVVLLCATMPSPSSCYYAIVTTQDVMVAKLHTKKRKKKSTPKAMEVVVIAQV